MKFSDYHNSFYELHSFLLLSFLLFFMFSILSRFFFENLFSHDMKKNVLHPRSIKVSILLHRSKQALDKLFDHESCAFAHPETKSF